MDKRLVVLSQVNELNQYFIHHEPIVGFSQASNTIYDSSEFIEWRESAKYQLSNLKPSAIIDEAIELLDKFDGWTDEENLKKLQAKIHIILNNPEDFLPEKEDEHIAKTEKLAKGTIVLTVFDDYELIKQIGQGGNGKVFSAKDSKGNDVAIKFVERNETEKKYKRLKNEISFCEKNNHENIIHVIDHGIAFLNEKKYIFYVMPLYPKTLRDSIKEGINPNDAIKLFIGIIQGLKFAHENNTIHRDIKPENILIDNKGTPIICDFGIAHFAEDDLITAVETQSTDRLANFQYAAPEQKVKGNAKNVTGQADVYAAALILNEMFTNTIPQAVGYKKIGEINSEYTFLDTLFEQLYKQNPDERLYPAEKILNELCALIENSMEAKKKAELKKTIVPDVCDIDFRINIIRKFFRDNGIVFVLDQPYSIEWFSMLVSGSYTHNCVLGFEPKKMYGADDNNSIVMPLKYNVDDSTLKTIVENVHEWVNQANQQYLNTLKIIAENKGKKELEERAKRIEEAERAQKINAFLANI